MDKDVLAKIVASEILRMKGEVFICSRNGRPLSSRNSGHNGDDEDVFSSSIEVTENGRNVFVRFYIIIKFGISISETCEALFDNIEQALSDIGAAKPAIITACIKGVHSKKTAPRNLEIFRDNINTGEEV